MFCNASLLKRDHDHGHPTSMQGQLALRCSRPDLALNKARQHGAPPPAPCLAYQPQMASGSSPRSALSQRLLVQRDRETVINLPVTSASLPPLGMGRSIMLLFVCSLNQMDCGVGPLQGPATLQPVLLVGMDQQIFSLPTEQRITGLQRTSQVLRRCN